MVDPARLNPASRPRREPKAAREGWRGEDVSRDELVDDAYIEQDPDSVVVVQGGDSGPTHLG